MARAEGHVAEPAQRPRLLLVDDDPLISDSLGFILNQQFEVSTVESRICR